MSDRYKGAILSPTAPTVTPQSAGGIYTTSQQFQYQGQGVWPSAVNYPINNSLRFRASASAYLDRTFPSAGNRKTYTLSLWVKRGTLGGSASQFFFGSGLSTTAGGFYFTATDNIEVNPRVNNTNTFLTTTQVFRDPSAWYHIVFSLDTTQATDSNRMKLYVNGVQVTAFSTAVYPALNGDSTLNNNIAHWIGRYAEVGFPSPFDGYLAEYNFIDGQALTPSSFGTTDAYGVWQPIPYTGTYGTNGFYLPFTDNSALTTSSNVGLGKDFSGNANYWTTNNISITSGSTYDSMTDVPTNTNQNTANYAVFNPLRPSGATITNGNLTATTGTSGSSNVGYLTATFWMPTSGKYYFEVTPTTVGEIAIGLTTDSNNRAAIYYRSGEVYINGSVSFTGSSYTDNDVIGVAVDMDALTIRFYKNNTAQGSGTSSLSAMTGPFVPAIVHLSSSGSATAAINFGQRPFSYTPPTGFNRLNTYNLPTPTILDGDQYFNAVTYTGTSGTQSVTGVGFQPDFVWIKNRTSTLSHVLQDAVRGTTAYLVSNATTAENTNTASNWFRSFNSDGFTVATLTDPGGVSTNEWNNTGYNYVSWNWKANGAGSSNTQGTITSTVSANTTAGFSIVTWTGNGASSATIGHGLGVAPSMIIVKNRSATWGWFVYNRFLTNPNTGRVQLNLTNGEIAGGTPGPWNNTAPTSTVFSLGDSTFPEVNGSGNLIVAYCFAPIAGYSAFGSYTGNGSSDGPFIYTGFRPRFVMIKASSIAGENWYIVDSSRSPYNAAILYLSPNNSGAEASPGAAQFFDFLSNGFKLRVSGSYSNSSGATYIYMAFAENPFKISRAR